jgi:hypothetical protein
MTPLDVVLADIATLELARDGLPLHSHIATLYCIDSASLAGGGGRRYASGAAQESGLAGRPNHPMRLRSLDHLRAARMQSR